MKSETITFWAVVFILQFLFIAWYKGLFISDSGTVLPSDAVVMTVTEARLTKQAIEQVREAVVAGKIRDVIEEGIVKKTAEELTLEALSSELPEAVRERVMEVLGHPSIGGMSDALGVLESRIKEK